MPIEETRSAIFEAESRLRTTDMTDMTDMTEAESWVRERFPKVSGAVDAMARDRNAATDWDDLKRTLCAIYQRSIELRSMDLGDDEIEAILERMLIVRYKH